MEHLAHFSGQHSFFCFYGLFERERLTSLSLYALQLVLLMRVSPIDWISQQDDQFDVGYEGRSSFGRVRMKQVVRAGLSRDVLAAATHLHRKIGTVPVVAFSEFKVEIVYFLGKARLHLGMLCQELVEKSGTALLRSDNDKVG